LRKHGPVYIYISYHMPSCCAPTSESTCPAPSSSSSSSSKSPWIFAWLGAAASPSVAVCSFACVYDPGPRAQASPPPPSPMVWPPGPQAPLPPPRPPQRYIHRGEAPAPPYPLACLLVWRGLLQLGLARRCVGLPVCRVLLWLACRGLPRLAWLGRELPWRGAASAAPRASSSSRWQRCLYASQFLSAPAQRTNSTNQPISHFSHN
jgi:hypothetical protein